MVEVIKTTDFIIEEVENIAPHKIAVAKEDIVLSKVAASKNAIKGRIERPETVEAKVYKLKSRFVNQRLYITLSYIIEGDGAKRPIEIFINSKDLSKLPEYTVLTRLISAIFRNFNDPKFILDELQSIYDPNGGYFLKGRYIYSFYSEIAMIIERFFYDIGFLKEERKLDNWIDNAKKLNPDKEIIVDNFKICPTCNNKSLQLDGGCLQCINPECGYSKCD